MSNLRDKLIEQGRKFEDAIVWIEGLFDKKEEDKLYSEDELRQFYGVREHRDKILRRSGKG